MPKGSDVLLERKKWKVDTGKTRREIRIAKKQVARPSHILLFCGRPSKYRTQALTLFAFAIIIYNGRYINRRYGGQNVPGGSRMKYLSVTQTAEKWGISARRVQILCSGNRIPGAVRIGHTWAIPDNAPKPEDARIKSGKYIKPKTR